MIESAFDEIILRAVMNGFHPERLGALPAEQDDGRVAGLDVHARKRLRPIAVGKFEIEKNEVDSAFAKAFEPVLQTFARFDAKWHLVGFRKQLPQQTDLL